MTMSAATGPLTRFPTASGGITRLALERLRCASIAVAPLLRQAGLRATQVENPDARLSVASQIEFLEGSADALDDSLLGFHLAQDFELRRIGLLYFVLASSDTLIEALKRAERYGRVVNEAISLQCAAGPDLRIRLSMSACRVIPIGSRSSSSSPP